MAIELPSSGFSVVVLNQDARDRKRSYDTDGRQTVKEDARGKMPARRMRRVIVGDDTHNKEKEKRKKRAAE